MKIKSNYTLSRWFKSIQKKYIIDKTVYDPIKEMKEGEIEKYYLQQELQKIQEYYPSIAKNKEEHVKNIHKVINCHNVRLFQLNTRLYTPTLMEAKDTKLYQESNIDGLKNFKHYDETHPDNITDKLEHKTKESEILGSFNDYCCYNYYLTEDIKKYINISPDLSKSCLPKSKSCKSISNFIRCDPQTLFPFQFNIPAGGIIKSFDRSNYKKNIYMHQAYLVTFTNMSEENRTKLIKSIDFIQKQLYNSLLGKKKYYYNSLLGKKKYYYDSVTTKYKFFTSENLKLSSIIDTTICKGECYDSGKYYSNNKNELCMKLFMCPYLINKKSRDYVITDNTILSKGTITLGISYIIRGSKNYIIYPHFYVNRDINTLKTINILNLNEGKYDDILNIHHESKSKTNIIDL